MLKVFDNKKINIEIVLLYILLFTSVDTILFGTNASLFFRYIPRIVGLLSSFMLLIIYFFEKKSKETRMTILFLTIGALFLVSCLHNNNDAQGALSRFISILTGYAIACNLERKLFFKIFSSFVFFVCVVAIITEIIAYIAPNIFNVFPLVTNSVDHQFRTFFIGSVEVSELGHTFIRSNGIFWEPGAFAIYIVIALIFELFFFDSINYKRVFVEIVGMLITFSTTGYICLFALILVFLFFRKINKVSEKKFKGFLLVAFFLAISFMVFSSEILKDEIFGKIFSQNSSAGSRFSSLYNGIAISFKYPFFGLGDNSNEVMKEYMSTTSTWYANGGTNINNTLTGYMASYGIPFGLLLMIGTFLSLRLKNGGKIVFILLCAVIALAYCGERFFSFLPFVLMFFGFKNEKLIGKETCFVANRYEKNCNYKYI